MDLVSIIMPYYQKKDYVFETINNVLKQTYSKFELIIIFDDNDEEILKKIYELTKLDKRIKLIQNDTNLGAGISRNVGLNHANGDYVCFLDSDDLWDENKVREQLKFMKKNNCMISHTSYQIIDKNNKVIGFREAKYLNYQNLLYSCDVGLSSVMMKSELSKQNLNFCDLKTKEDYVYWLKLSSDGNDFFPLKKFLMRWRKTHDSLSSSTFQKLLDGYKVYRVHQKFGVIRSLFHLVFLSVNFLIKNYFK